MTLDEIRRDHKNKTRSVSTNARNSHGKGRITLESLAYETIEQILWFTNFQPPRPAVAYARIERKGNIILKKRR